MKGNIPTDIFVPTHLLAIRRLIQKQLKVMIPENYLNTFELELKFLRTFLNYTAKRGFEYQNLEDLLMRSEAVDRRARSGQDSLISIYDCYEFENAFYNTADHVLDEIKLLKPEIGEVHRIVSRSSQSHNCMSNELLIEFIYSLLENLKDLISFKVDLVDPLKIKLESLEGKLRFLRTFLLFVGKTCTEHEKLDDLFTHAKVAADNAASLSYSCLVDKMDEEKIHTLAFDLSDLARKIDSVISGVRPIYLRALKASSVPPQLDLYTSGSDKITVDFVESLLENVRELLRVDWTVPMRDQIEILQEELTFLRSFLTYLLDLYTDTETLSNLLRLSQAISSCAASVVYSLYDNEMSEETAENVYSSLVDLLEEIKVFKEEIPKIYLKSSWPNLPRTDELGFFDSFLRDLRGMLKNRTSSIECLNLPIEPLLEDLQLLRSFLGEIAKQRTEQDKLKVLWTQIIDVAYKAEYIIDLLLIESSPIWHLMPWISEVRKYIEFLKAEVNEIGEIKLNESEVHHGAKISGYASLQTTSPEWDDISVGFEDEEEKIVDVLVRGSRKLEMVSIVGMPGLGKTHLAKKIYNNLTVKDYFHVRAWCFVSQLYDRKYLLTRILSQVAEPTKEMSNMEDEELAAALYRSLRGKRYLILMDDLWDVEAWDALRRSFPDDKNGSRMTFTSRFHNLNLKDSSSKIHHLRRFSDNESWQLLQKKLFQSESCPLKLLEVGKQIAKDCNGLPLAVVVIAGVLERIDKKPEQWREVANSLSSYMVSDPEKLAIKVIELSYKNLPDYLKSCFLYIGAFSKKISVRKLICLWIAEGFVQQVEEKSLENIAVDYLMDLIGRSLIIIAKRKSTGAIKECLVHDLVREFCSEKAKDDNFLQLMEMVRSSDFSRDIICGQRRISCNEFPEELLVSKAYRQQLRSLLFFSSCEWPTQTALDLSSIYCIFRLLRVLDLEGLFCSRKFLDGIVSLTHLRYLAICCNMLNFTSSSIANLRNLETFILSGSLCVVCLPDTIWNMVKLRHIRMSFSFIIRPSPSHISRFDNLQTISGISLSCRNDRVDIVERFPNVKKLGCSLSHSRECCENCNRYSVLATLSQLESLKITFRGKWLRTYEFSLPPNLKKLTMSRFCNPWNRISIIGKLPNLEVLKLVYRAFEGEEWDMVDGEFPKLKFLKLVGLDIRRWSVSGDHFPPLEQLVLQKCRQLEEIPFHLGNIPTLNMIEVKECNSHLEEVVNQIEEEQLDFGNQEFKVVVGKQIEVNEELPCAEDISGPDVYLSVHN